MKRLILLVALLMGGCAETRYANVQCTVEEYYEANKFDCDSHSKEKWTPFWQWVFVSQHPGVQSPYLDDEVNARIRARSPVTGADLDRALRQQQVSPNAYGPGIGMDATGQPVTLQGGTPNSYIQTPNAYGPGIHMDQYGNPVQYK